MANKTLTRDTETKIIAGVVAGLAKYFDHDPILFRLAAITFIILSGVLPGLIIYVIAWLIIPSQTKRADYIISE